MKITGFPTISEQKWQFLTLKLTLLFFMESICNWFQSQKTAHKLIHDVKIHIFVNRFAATFKPIMQLWSYYPVVPAVVGTTSSSDMTGFEASGGCHWQDGPSCFYASVISCNVNVTQPHIFFINRVISTDWYPQSDFNIVTLTEIHL